MTNQKSLKTRMLSALVSLVLAFGLLPALPAVALADEGNIPQIALTVDGQALPLKYLSADSDGAYYKLSLSEPVSKLYLLNADSYHKYEDRNVVYTYESMKVFPDSDNRLCLVNYQWINASSELTGSVYDDGAIDLAANDYFVIRVKNDDPAFNYSVCIENPKGAYFGAEFSATAGGEALKTVELADKLVGLTTYVVTVPAGTTHVYMSDASTYGTPYTIKQVQVETEDDGAIALSSIPFSGNKSKTAKYTAVLSDPEATFYVLCALDVNQQYIFEMAPELPATPSLSLGTEASDLKVGQEFTVNVSMENVTAAAQANLTWSEGLELVKVEQGSALSGEDMAFVNVAGNGLFSFVANEGEIDGVVAVATFKCVAPGEVALGLTGGLAGKTIDSDEYEIADPEALTLSVGLAGIKGDVNNNAKVNIVDAQIAYDLACGKYVAGSDAASALVACWGNGATLDMVKAIADVNTVAGLDAADAFAIQYFVHYGEFGPVTD